MAVRLLATFPLITLKGAQVTDVAVQTWYPHVGLIVGNNLWTSVATMDGVCVEVTNFGNAGGFFGTEWSWCPVTQRLVSMGNDGYEVMWEPKTLLWQSTHPDDRLSNVNNIEFSYIKLADRRIFFESNNSRIMAQYLGPTMFPVVEKAGFPFSSGVLHAGRGDFDVWVASPANARGCFYDTIEKQISSPVYFIDTRVQETLQQIVYAPEYGVLVSGHIVNTPTTEVPWARVIRIWSLEVNPTVLQPIALFAGTIRAGQTVTYRTRLVGAHNDPAEGELVNWFVEGVGQLIDIQSKTDADGYAMARVRYGLTDTGSSVVTARVTC